MPLLFPRSPFGPIILTIWAKAALTYLSLPTKPDGCTNIIYV